MGNEGKWVVDGEGVAGDESIGGWYGGTVEENEVGGVEEGE